MVPSWVWNDIDYCLVLSSLDDNSALITLVFCHGLHYYHHNIQLKYHQWSKKVGQVFEDLAYFHWNMSPACATQNGSLVNLCLPNWHANLVYISPSRVANLSVWCHASHYYTFLNPYQFQKIYELTCIKILGSLLLTFCPLAWPI